MVNVETGQFVGPFDVLLELIEKSKLDIYDIQISEITNSYIDKINSMDIPPEEITDFLLIATQLLYLKTKTLVEDTIQEEEEEDEISKEELIRRLVEYKKFKILAKKISGLQEHASGKFTKLQEDLTIFFDYVEEDPIVYEKNELKKALDLLIDKNTVSDDFEVDRVMNRQEYSVDEYIDKLKIKLINNRILSISKMLKKTKDRSEAVVIFLSMLELARQTRLRINQDLVSKEIILELREDGK